MKVIDSRLLNRGVGFSALSVCGQAIVVATQWEI